MKKNKMKKTKHIKTKKNKKQKTTENIFPGGRPLTVPGVIYINTFFKNLRVATAYRYSPVPFLVKPATPMRYVPSFRLLNVILVVSVFVFIVLVVFGSSNETYVIS